MSNKFQKKNFYTWSEYMKHETYLAAFCKNRLMDIPQEVTKVKWIAGCCFIVDAFDFERIGMFDEHTIFYIFEEYIFSGESRKSWFQVVL